LTDPSPGGRFERHPRLTGAGLLAGALVALELALRLFAPVPLRFAHAMREVHGYSRVARVDLRPSQSARLRIEPRGGEPLFDFRITTGSDAFRIVEGEDEAAPRAARYVHAIGDSYTMGWGVDAPLSYPAQLARRLGPGLAVLNLGVDGFGAIGATAKSRALADSYPPAVAVYLFCPNDLDDDVQAAAVARRGKAAHAAYEAFDALRRASYLAGVPFALRYRLQFRAGAAGTETRQTGTEPNQTETTLEPTRLLLPEPAAPPAPQERPTFAALREYRDFLETRGARLVVLVLSNQHESLMAYRFCKEQGIEAHLFDVPPGMRIPDEGHFNALGNATVAALVEQLLRKAPNGAGS
jgi:lysophospholipase L1-like esterase